MGAPEEEETPTVSYYVGIDLGTTFSGAAVSRDGTVTMFNLGSRSAAVPSVVLLRADEQVLTGEAAVRRALTEPERVAREFKRRLGDTTPILVGGSPYSAEALSARLLRSVLDEIRTREGGDPEAVAVTHPANWGPYKVDLLRQALRLADLDAERVILVSEPEAAAISYASTERVEPGQIVAVYDLGGGTFDAAVLRRTDTGFEILGRPEGIERLGGIDFDMAVFGHVQRALGGALEELDPEDSAVQAAVARLRQDCVEAKEALSSDTDAAIPVMLPTVQTEVRITRAEFEALIRPSLADSLDAMRRAFRSAGVEVEDVDRILLVGGSSRIPLVAQLVASELGRPVALDSHPKHAVALGAAVVAAQKAPSPSGTTPEPEVVVPAAPEPAPAAVPAAPPAAAVSPTSGGSGGSSGGGQERGVSSSGGGRSRFALIGGVAAAAIAAIVIGVVALGGGSNDSTSDVTTTVATASPDTAAAAQVSTTVATTVAPTTVPSTTTTRPPITTAPTTTTTIDPESECDEMQLQRACLTDARLVDGGTRIEAVYDWSGFTPNVSGGYHFHFYGNSIDETEAGLPGDPTGWVVWDLETFEASLSDASSFAGSSHLCVLVATPEHSILPGTGNCLRLESA